MGTPQLTVALLAGSAANKSQQGPTTGGVAPPAELPEVVPDKRSGDSRRRRRRRQLGAQGRGSLILGGQLGQANIGVKTLTGQ